METSSRSSTSFPPRPNVITFPNDGSVFPPISTSSPAGICFSTMIPVTAASGARAALLCMMVRNASSASSGPSIPVMTPPTSLLWTISGEMTFMTTG